MVRQALLDVAETTDAWRVFPRLFMFIFLTILTDTHYWFIRLEEPNGFHTAYVTAVWGAVAAVTKFYVNTGRKWDVK